jgi:hypothetical protein
MTDTKGYTWTIQVNADQSYFWQVFNPAGEIAMRGEAPSRAAAILDAYKAIHAIKRRKPN